MGLRRRWLFVSDDPATQQFLRACVRLDGATSFGTFDAAQRAAVVEAVKLHGLAGGGLRVIDTAAGAGDELRPALVGAQIEASVWDLRVEQIVAEVDDLLVPRGIEWRILKGPATARLWYDDSNLRHTRDLDLLVRPDDFDEARRLLATICPDVVPLRGPTCQRQFKEATFTHESGVEVDLHQWVAGAMPAIRFGGESWWERPQTITVGGRPVLAPSDDAMALGLLAHLSTENVRLSSVSDLAVALTRPSIDWEWVVGEGFARGRASMSHWSLVRAADWIDVGALTSRARHRSRRWAPEVVRAWAFTSSVGYLTLKHATTPQRMRRFRETLFPTQAYRSYRAGLGR